MLTYGDSKVHRRRGRAIRRDAGRFKGNRSSCDRHQPSRQGPIMLWEPIMLE
jgi:hypothetical protein